jgi:Zn-dependent protease
MRITYSEEELIHLLHAWAAISFAFAVVLSGGLRGLGPQFVLNLIVAGITVGTAFLLHELAHKVLAQKYSLWAEFRKFNLGLVLAVAMSFFGFIIAAPGAVMISGQVTREQNGKISAAGPLTNIALAILFFIAGVFLPQAFGALPALFNKIIFFGFVINSWLALFNMIPFPPLDGSKVMAWSLPVWLGITAIAGFMVFFM